MRKLRNVISAVMVTVALGFCPAFAYPPAHHERAFFGRSLHSFTPHELEVWRGGHWVHDWHEGRYAWWWVVDGWWYFYPEPVYPYPLYVPPAVVVEQPSPQPTGTPPGATWYFCDNPEGYYPYVGSCNVPWRSVPTAPTPGPASAPAK